MFLDKYNYLCTQNGKSPNAVAKELSIASGTVSEWKKGRKPQNSTIKKISEYFGVPVQYFDEDSPALPELFTSREVSLIRAYRAHPEMQPAIDKLLGINGTGTITIYTAASSDDSVHDEYTDLGDEEFTALKNEPEAEDVN